MKKIQSVRLIFMSLLLSRATLVCFAQQSNDLIYWKLRSGAYCNAPLLRDSVLFCGSMDSVFYAFSAKTGDEIWRFKTQSIITSSATIQQDVVCFESGNTLFGLHAKTGKLLWSYLASNRQPSTGQPTDYHHSSPLIYNNTVFYGDEWGNLNGINITSGQLIFRYTIKKLYTRLSNYNIRTKPAIYNGIIYFADYGANVYAVSLNNSTEKWIHKMSSPKWDGSLVSDVVIRDSSVYIGGYNNQFSPLDIKTGEPRWVFTDNNTFLPSTPVFYHGNVILGTTINANKIHCLNASTGKVIWTTSAKGIFFVKPVIVNDSLLVINSTDPFADKVGVLYFVNCKNGKILKQLYLSNACESSPLISGDTLYLGRNDGMYAINYKAWLVKNNSTKLDFRSKDD